ncbi:uncharacterized protein PV09_09057 [Verruconis gallopava]|uniref:Pentatricopeptide repeat domain-containing protein n=1 Tax=Verruconis gallopava TaxID=253628 RepID=A0A0D1ZYX8_9PEZI|nr:uncharacterized protein PV09_09057 [Verruconis gallopava]KIV99289.1 hypothetical protein PV09_09057 [Verruconis gallopava]
MSFLRTFERASSCGNTYEIASFSLSAFLCPILYDRIRPKTTKQHERQRTEALFRTLPPAVELETCFIAALVRASSCHGHYKGRYRPQNPLSQYSGACRPRELLSNTAFQCQRRNYTKTARCARNSSFSASIGKEDLHALVDIYGARREEHEHQVDTPIDPVPVRVKSSEQPFEDADVVESHYLINPEPSSEASRILADLSSLLEDPDTPHEVIYALYRQLPGSRICYLSVDLRKRLLKFLSQVPAFRFKIKYADNFLSILHDMRAENIPVDLALWSTAIRFLGLSEGPHQAVRMWREMENHYGLRANNYIFSILFDLAAKHNSFALAEMIEKEARERNVKLDRISRMSRIFYYGILGDGLNVRRAYAQLVEAGEIVDTAVLTNVISALIDAGEYPAAVETFERMKHLHATKKGATHAPNLWRERRELRILLTKAGHHYRRRPEERQKFQDLAPINPDWRTYRVFLRYHALVTGEWQEIERLLSEMRRAKISLNSEIYAVIFSGFAKHGGIQLAAWTRHNLESLWQEFKKANTEDPVENSLNSHLVSMIMAAFRHCADRTRARSVWETILERWRPPRRLDLRIRQLLKK